MTIFRSSWLATIVATAVTAATYLALLSWGDYEAWRWIGFAVILAGLGVLFGIHERGWSAVASATVVTAVFSGVDFSTAPTPPGDANLWVVGTILLTVTVFAGMAVVALIGGGIIVDRRRKSSPSRSQ